MGIQEFQARKAIADKLKDKLKKAGKNRDSDLVEADYNRAKRELESKKNFVANKQKLLDMYNSSLKKRQRLFKELRYRHPPLTLMPFPLSPHVLHAEGIGSLVILPLYSSTLSRHSTRVYPFARQKQKQKKGTYRAQTGRRLGTDRAHTGHRPGADWGESGHRLAKTRLGTARVRHGVEHEPPSAC